MRILVIFTGGTIGSTKSDGWINTDAAANYRLINDYQSKHGRDVDFVIETPYLILSEQLCAKELTLLIGSICDGVKADYDGIIVAHGTDTLQYSAAATAFCVGCDCIPVVFVSANYPLEHEMSNGKANFEAAVEFIASRIGRGVYVCYENQPKGKVDIHLAARVLRHAECSDMVFSYNNAPYAVYRNGSIDHCRDFVPSEVGTPCGAVDFCYDPGILTISASPTEQYNYDLSKYRAAVLLPYHSGTLNTESPQLAAFCQTARQQDLPVFLPNLPRDGAYDSMRAYDRLGVIALRGCASIPIIMKIWIAVSLRQDIRRFVTAPIAQEFTP